MFAHTVVRSLPIQWSLPASPPFHSARPLLLLMFCCAYTASLRALVLPRRLAGSMSRWVAGAGELSAGKARLALGNLLRLGCAALQLAVLQWRPLPACWRCEDVARLPLLVNACAVRCCAVQNIPGWISWLRWLSFITYSYNLLIKVGSVGWLAAGWWKEMAGGIGYNLLIKVGQMGGLIRVLGGERGGETMWCG